MCCAAVLQAIYRGMSKKREVWRLIEEHLYHDQTKLKKGGKGTPAAFGIRPKRFVCLAPRTPHPARRTPHAAPG